MVEAQTTYSDNFKLRGMEREGGHSCAVLVEIDAGQAGSALSARVHAHQPAHRDKSRAILMFYPVM
jgi:hypothetical protein